MKEQRFTLVMLEKAKRALMNAPKRETVMIDGKAYYLVCPNAFKGKKK